MGFLTLESVNFIDSYKNFEIVKAKATLFPILRGKLEFKSRIYFLFLESN